MLNFKTLKDFDFDRSTSRKFLAIVITIYLGLASFELFIDECEGVGDCFDFDRRNARLYDWDLSYLESDFRHFVHMGLLVLSYNVFGNFKVLVLASSALLLLITWLFTVRITEKRWSGFVSIAVVLASSNFYLYDTSQTYPSFWATLYIFSLYVATTPRYYFSPLVFLISIPAKALTGLYLPASLAFFKSFKTENTKKLFLLYLVLILIGLTAFILFSNIGGYESGFSLFSKVDFVMFASGFISWTWMGFADDQITLLLLFTSGFLLFYNRKQIKNSNSMLILLVLIILPLAFVNGFTTYSIWPYRMLPIVCIVGIITALVTCNLHKIDFSMFSTRKPR